MADFTFDGTWETTADPDAVWEVLADPSRWTGWWENIDRVETDGDWADGGRATLVFRTPIPGRTVSTRIHAEELEPPRRIVLAGGGAFAGRGEMVVAPADGGSTVDYRLAFRTTRFWLRPIEPVLRRAAQAGGSAAMREAGQRLARMAGGELR